MSRLEEIKNEYAKTFGSYYEWSDFINSKPNYEVVQHMDNVCVTYAEECVKASLDKASKNAECDARDYNDYFVDKESITNPENIILL